MSRAEDLDWSPETYDEQHKMQKAMEAKRLAASADSSAIQSLIQDVAYSHERACVLLEFPMLPGGLAANEKHRELIWHAVFGHLQAIVDWCKHRRIHLGNLIDKHLDATKRQGKMESKKGSMFLLVILRGMYHRASKERSLSRLRECRGNLQIRHSIELLQGAILEANKESSGSRIIKSGQRKTQRVGVSMRSAARLIMEEKKGKAFVETDVTEMKSKLQKDSAKLKELGPSKKHKQVKLYSAKTLAEHPEVRKVFEDLTLKDLMKRLRLYEEECADGP